MGVYRPNPTGFAQIANSPRLRQHMLAVGEYWANDLRAAAPRGPSGDYANSITVHSVTEEVNGLSRVGVQITANVLYAAILEVGAKHIPNPPRPLTKLLDRIQAADPNSRKKPKG